MRASTVSAVVGGEAVAIPHAAGGHHGDRVQHHAQREHAVDADGGEQQAADRRSHHATGVVGADIDRHRGAHLRGADHLADHHPPHRIVGRPADAVDEAGDGQMPHREQVQVRQHRQHERGRHHAGDDDDERGAPLHPLGHRAQERAEQTHRQQAQHRHHGNDEGGAGGLVDEHADRDGLHPADHENHQPDEPEAPEISVVDQPRGAAGGSGRCCFMHLAMSALDGLLRAAVGRATAGSPDNTAAERGASAGMASAYRACRSSPCCTWAGTGSAASVGWWRRSVPRR